MPDTKGQKAEDLFPKRDDGLKRPVAIKDSIKGVMQGLEKHLDRTTA